MKIKTFRGLLADEQQEHIRLEHRDGKIGYKIRKLQLMGNTPGDETFEAVVKVYSIKQTTVDGIVDFGEQTLLAAAFYVSSTTEEWQTHNIAIFDNMTFNQDIYITHKDVSTGIPVNYYMELEQYDLDETEATATILKNFRNTNSYQS